MIRTAVTCIIVFFESLSLVSHIDSFMSYHFSESSTMINRRRTKPYEVGINTQYY